jgi:hypothetical protein
MVLTQKPQDVAGKRFNTQHVEVERATLRPVVDQEGVRAVAATVVHHVTHTDAGAGAAAKGTGTLRGACAWAQEAFRESDARQEVKPAWS